MIIVSSVPITITESPGLIITVSPSGVTTVSGVSTTIKLSSSPLSIITPDVSSYPSTNKLTNAVSLHPLLEVTTA